MKQKERPLAFFQDSRFLFFFPPTCGKIKAKAK
jgi:hypothetical protein